MSPAQRRNRLSRYKKGKVSKKGRMGRFSLLAIFAILVFLFILIFKILSSKEKISFVSGGAGGDIFVSVFDPHTPEINVISIPGSTELEVSRSLGKWKAKSLWQLSINEKSTGKLLAETVTKDFSFPVYKWADKEALGFSQTNFKDIFKALIFPYKTNLTFAEKIRLFAISLSVKSFDKTLINLSDSSYLRKKILSDGEAGYVVSGSIPPELAPIFTDEEINKKAIKVEILDATGTYNVAERLGGVVEVLGAKVASIDKKPKEETDCVLFGKDLEVSKKIANIFSCKYDKDIDKEDFDIKIKIGTVFAKRF